VKIRQNASNTKQCFSKQPQKGKHCKWTDYVKPKLEMFKIFDVMDLAMFKVTFIINIFPNTFLSGLTFPRRQQTTEGNRHMCMWALLFTKNLGGHQIMNLILP
jgi:hypothetical protein